MTTPAGREWREQLARLLEGAASDVLVAAPYVSAYGIDFLIEHLPLALRHAGTLTIVCDLSPQNVAQGSTEVAPLLRLTDECRAIRVVHLPRLHCKVYVADESQAIVTSGNLTRGGLLHNFEYGLRLNDIEAVRHVRRDVLDYASVGTDLDVLTLSDYARHERQLREAGRQATRQTREDAEFGEAVDAARAVLARSNSTEEAVTSVFERTVLYVLRREGPLTTPEIHDRVRALRPDLCDEADRIIDGQSYGRKWKHAVRTAQQHLKRRGALQRIEDHWSAV